MNAEVLKSYVVSLGWDIDNPGLARLEQTLSDVGREIQAHTEGVARMFAVMGTGVAAVYGAIGAATVALADKVSQAELGYQLFSMRLYTTTDAGKKLKIAMDALGHSLEEIAWNPELRERYRELVEDQTKLQAGLGPDYERQMRQLRDFRFQITRLQVGMQYMAMSLVNNLAKAFGLDEGKLKSWVTWFIEHTPELANKISQHLVPILRDTYYILKDLTNIAGSVLSLIPTLWEALGGDPQGRIKQQRTELERFAVTIEEISRAIRNLVDLVKKYKDSILMGIGIGGGASFGFTAGSAFGPLGSVIGALLGGAAGGIGTYLLGTRNSKEHAAMGGPSTGNINAADRARELSKQVSARTGVPADWIFGAWAHETNFFRSRAFREQNNLGGIKDGANYRTFGSMEESADYYARLLMSPRYRSARDANTDAGFVLGMKQGGYFEDTYANYLRGIRRFEQSYSKGDVNVGGVTVHINQPGAGYDEIYRATVDAVDDRLGKHTQNNLSEAGGPY